MGTTLQNGVYLPNEGERNCYAGLKTNWEILDQKVADVTALQQAVAGALHREIVASLPTTDIDPNTIYMILSGTSATENVYNEFMYVNNAWELIGTSATDLTNYYTKGDVDGLLLLKANASDLTSHTGDTTIHVTASDKTKWTNSANTHVLRLALSALTPSTSDNSFSNLDDSTALKVGDKVMDTAGVLFEVTAIDTQNSTFTIGTALIDLAQDSDVVHKSGNETVSGNKTFTDEFTASRNTTNGVIVFQNASYDPKTNGQSGVTTKSFAINFTTSLSDTFGAVSCYGISERTMLRLTSRYFVDSQTVTEDSVEYNLYGDGTRSFRPRNNNNCSLGEAVRKWKDVYATNYYYGSNNVEFSTKFVTTDTNQTISGDKVWTGTNTFQQNVTYQRTNFYHQVVNPCYILKDTELEKGSLATTHTSYPGLWHDKNGNVLGYVRFVEYSSGRQTAEFNVSNLIKNGTLDPTGSEVNCTVTLELQPSGEKSLIPEQNNDINLGTATKKWKTFNGVEPSSLSLPSDRSARIDISSYITNLGNGGNNQYIVPANGYIWLHFTSISSALCYSQTSGGLTNYSQTFARYSGEGQLYAFFPVRKDDYFIVQIYTSSTAVVQSAYFIPCQGNV